MITEIFRIETGAVKFQYCPLGFLANNAGHQQAQILEQKRYSDSR
jgi:hypothetical protein